MRGGLALVLLYGLLQSAYAAHPLITEDTDTQGTGNHQIEINTDHSRQDSASRKVANLTYTYGATDDLDLFVNTPWSLSSPSGINDAGLGAKWRLISDNGTSLVLEPVLSLPSGNTDKGLGTGNPGASVLLGIQQKLGVWTLQGNLAVSFTDYKHQVDRDANRNRLWRVSTAARYAIDKQWQLIGDIGTTRDSDKSRNGYPAYLVTGAIYSPIESLDLDAGLRFGLNCPTCSMQVHRQFGAGLTWRF